jgi:hypothetical protein
MAFMSMSYDGLRMIGNGLFLDISADRLKDLNAYILELSQYHSVSTRPKPGPRAQQGQKRWLTLALLDAILGTA